VKILSITHSVPTNKVDNAQIIQSVLKKNINNLTRQQRKDLRVIMEKYFDKIGLKSRYLRSKEEKAIDHGIAAVNAALEESQIKPSDIDLLLYVGVGRGWIEPAMANLFIAELDLINATGFDLVDACASWIRGLDLARNYLNTGMYRNILIMNCEFNFKEFANFQISDLSRLEYFLPTFTIGEAATATIVTSDKTNNMYYSKFKTWGEYHDLCKIPLHNVEEFCKDGKKLHHEPLKFYAYGTQLTEQTIKKMILTFRKDKKLSQFIPNICFGHSVSEAITSQVERMLNFKYGSTYRIFSDYGNTVSASIPLAMSLAINEGVLKKGDSVLLVAGSAGISVGFTIFIF